MREWSEGAGLKSCAADVSGGTGLQARLWLFGAAAAARAIYLFICLPSLDSYYLGLADSLVNTGVLGFDGRPSTAFEPVYPFFLAAARLLFGEHVLLIQLLQLCIAAFGAPLLYHLTWNLTASPRAATWAGALFALHPLLIRQASAASDLAITTTLIIGFALAFVRISSQRTAMLAGLMLGFTVLTRSMVFPIVGLAAAILFMRRRHLQAVAFAMAAMAASAPMIARTYVLSGSLVPTRGGINLYIGNSPYTAALLPTYDLDLLEPVAEERFVRARPDISPRDPRFDVEYNAFLTREAFEYIVEHPWASAGQKVLSVAYLLSPRIAPFDVSGPDTRVRIEGDRVAAVEHSVPRRRSETVAHAVTSLVLLVGYASGVYLRRRELHRDAILWSIAVTFVVVNAIYVPATRYTAPMQFVLIFYTAVALVRVRDEVA